MKRKQILSIVLAAAMSVTLFAGCGQKNEESKVQESGSQVVSSQTQGSTEQAGEEDPYKDVRISDEVVTLTVAASSGATAQNWNDTLQFAEYEKRLGIKFDATTYTSEQWNSKLTLMMASDEMPDIVVGMGSRSEVQKYADEGYLLDFSQYLDIMPNLSRLMEEYPAYAKAITYDDGKIYGFTMLNNFGKVARVEYMFMSQTWLDNVGMERPKTLDEFYEVLKAFKEKDANGNGDPDDEIPMAYATNRRWSEIPIRYAFGIESNEEVVMWRADENGKVGLWESTDNYKDFLKFMHKLYTEKLMNDDAFVVDGAENDARGKEGKVGYIANVAEVGNTKELQDQFQWFELAGLTQEGYQDENVMVLTNNIGSGVNFVANANTEHPEVIAKFVDYLFTPEGSLSGGNGYADVTFDWIDVDGFPICDHGKKAEEAGMTQVDYRNKYLALGCFRFYLDPAGTIYDMLANADIEKLTDTNTDVWATTTVNALRAEATRRSDVVVKDPFPVLYYTDAEATERATIVTDLSSYLKNMKAQFITGEIDIDSNWDGYLKKMDEMGLPKLLEIDQAAYDRYNK